MSFKCILLTMLTLTSSHINIAFASPPYKSYDTGITYAGNYPKGINSDCKADSDSENSKLDMDFIGQQDCNAINRNNPPSKAFTYIKISSSGDKLNSNAKSWHCVIDKNNGLMWEVKQAQTDKDSLQNSADKYTWYNSNPKINGGDIGSWNAESASCGGYIKNKPRTYCHIEQFVSRVNKAGLCGFHDWRLPTRPELTTLIHFGNFQPAIDKNFFPNTINTFYWTSDPVAKRPLEAWAISFEFGFTTAIRKTDLRPVRLVRNALIHKALVQNIME